MKIRARVSACYQLCLALAIEHTSEAHLVNGARVFQT